MAKVVENVKFSGVEVELQNMSLIIAPLNFKAMREGAFKKLSVVINAFEAMDVARVSGDVANAFNLPEEAIDAAVDLIWMAASRNYPDISKDQIAEGLDMDNIQKIMPILFTKNPIKAVKEVKNALPQAARE